MSSHQGTVFNDYSLGFAQYIQSHISYSRSQVRRGNRQDKKSQGPMKMVCGNIPCYRWVGGVMVYSQKLRSPFQGIITLLESTSLEILNISY